MGHELWVGATKLANEFAQMVRIQGPISFVRSSHPNIDQTWAGNSTGEKSGQGRPNCSRLSDVAAFITRIKGDSR
jgi:hypothetical protein